jgi:hypothetical protein
MTGKFHNNGDGKMATTIDAKSLLKRARELGIEWEVCACSTRQHSLAEVDEWLTALEKRKDAGLSHGPADLAKLTGEANGVFWR